MELKQLKDYLMTALNLENAIMSCEEAISLLGKELALDNAFPGVPAPVIPEKPNYSDFQSPRPVKPPRPDKDPSQYAKKPIISPLDIVDHTVLGPAAAVIHYIVKKQNEKKTLDALEDEYQKKINAYNAQLNAWNQEDARLKALDDQKYKSLLAKWEQEVAWIQENFKTYSEKAAALWEEKESHRKNELSIEHDALIEKQISLKTALADFYGNGPIYPKFQNMIAIAQIYDYIASGIAFELEGPGGAYSQYMQDVRTERVRESIDVLRQEMSSKLDQIYKMQYVMCNQLREVNDQLQGIGNGILSLTSGLTAIREEISRKNKYHDDLSAKLSALEAFACNAAQAAQSSDHSGKSGLSTSFRLSMLNFNQYLDMKSRSLDAYYTSYPC